MNQDKRATSLYIVTDEDNLYVERVGSFVWEHQKYIMLNIDTENVHFLKSEVEQIA